MVTADKILSEAQLNKLLKTLKTEKEKSIQAVLGSNKRKPKEIRIALDYFVFTLIANTGLRISEALSLTKADIHSDFLIIRPEVSKNKKKGTVYFGNKTRKLLDEFLEFRSTVVKREFTDLLFSVDGNMPSRSYSHMRFKHWLTLSHLPTHFSIHSLRHTYATYALDSGVSLTFLRDNLRHSNISITSQYLHLTVANREKIKDLF